MDKHIEFSYCIFEAFEVLSRNYLRHEAHPLLDKIESLMETKIIPADVAENPMPKSPSDDEVLLCFCRLAAILFSTGLHFAIASPCAKGVTRT
ncbi:hypothetical protein NC652_029605 [Populus alba x Populus x berolinensis]|nr:hypothetical protein NC652_029605 [Populus alba x Populus x berolinensis]